MAGGRIPFGVVELPKEMTGFPKGQMKIRMRAGDIVTVYIRTQDGIEEWVPTVLADGRWAAGCKRSENKRRTGK